MCDYLITCVCVCVSCDQRRRLHTLQEDHSDLLGLLAQQEVELLAFRKVLSTEAGAGAVRNAEMKAEHAAIRKYGSYTNYRSTEGEDMVDFSELSP